MGYRKPAEGYDARQARLDREAAEICAMDKGLVEPEGKLVKNRVYRDLPETAGDASIGRMKGKQLAAFQAQMAARFAKRPK